MRVLHVAGEFFPYVKVGGLGDVMAALPRAQRGLGMDVRVLLPGYPALLEGIPGLGEVGLIPDLLGQGPARILGGSAAHGVPVYLLDHPLYHRPGGPYDEWGDSHLKFGAFSFAAAMLGRHGDARGWTPQILHLHDWQTGLAPAYLRQMGEGPRTVMTVHNLAFQGIYSAGVARDLWLGPDLFHPHGVEFYGDLSFLKAGLQLSDRLTTVSPTYAQEIQTPAFGERLEGLLHHRRQDLVGILNGVDTTIWNPARSPHLGMHYSVTRMSGKLICKNHLQRELGLEEGGTTPLLGVVSRLTHQKGLDLLLERVDDLVSQGAQLAVLGTGEPALEEGYRAAADRHPGRVAVVPAYSEPHSHKVIAGCDALVVPSRFEPCGLTQLYALAYGTLPVVRHTGGLADTVVDESLGVGATGFSFHPPHAEALGETLARALRIYRGQPKRWAAMMGAAMRQRHGWAESAERYLAVYQALVP